jgi:hypothetical protein
LKSEAKMENKVETSDENVQVDAELEQKIIKQVEVSYYVDYCDVLVIWSSAFVRMIVDILRVAAQGLWISS